MSVLPVVTEALHYIVCDLCGGYTYCVGLRPFYILCGKKGVDASGWGWGRDFQVPETVLNVCPVKCSIML
jgi:hypothetical protein